MRPVVGHLVRRPLLLGQVGVGQKGDRERDVPIRVISPQRFHSGGRDALRRRAELLHGVVCPWARGRRLRVRPVPTEAVCATPAALELGVAVTHLGGGAAHRPSGSHLLEVDALGPVKLIHTMHDLGDPERRRSLLPKGSLPVEPAINDQAGDEHIAPPFVDVRGSTDRCESVVAGVKGPLDQHFLHRPIEAVLLGHPHRVRERLEDHHKPLWHSARRAYACRAQNGRVRAAPRAERAYACRAQGGRMRAARRALLRRALNFGASAASERGLAQTAHHVEESLNPDALHNVKGTSELMRYHFAQG